ncbi:uncharacterized protein PODANS_0_260 [Podospora anserina S mat+]|uniref:Podospora anserina S mat+ genomic DNA chromosome 4, supercontig 2 n=1 Tax=Podospora anserina (strain S / ATCC MYA-4624 / DSM 980 / FGSC 10383) TaxID=515849 RepID=B2ADY4_PODAN|nr:uncharacterized protein PODANS_0_260 [Podospora anserina S mat+]CAP61649.1 unnamed protein product [Podospora anserina S mat+]CDP28000.1 Putative protein similar to YMR114C of Saccharomyces cerevisiae [Podospora anserina S mat+]
MCGRYAMALRPSQVRQMLQNDYDLQVDDTPADEGDGAPRQSYNFAPGYNGVVYRADAGAGHNHHQALDEPQEQDYSPTPAFKLQSMKWGLIPSWIKSSPSFPSTLKTINCRDDSLAQSGGMWASMKSKKRCAVIAQGFYEWLQKGKEKIPHYVKRKDGRLMLLAGLWDCASLPPLNGEGEGETRKVWSYTIITTSSNDQLRFLHDRMPVILDAESERLRVWLDLGRREWSKELQGVLRPYEGELEVYPVSKEVGKVGNDDAVFVVPVGSRENKGNIENFFANAAAKSKKREPLKGEVEVEMVDGGKEVKSVEEVKREDEEGMGVVVTEGKQGVKRETEDHAEEEPPGKKVKEEGSPSKNVKEEGPVKWESPVKERPKISATSNKHTRSPEKKKGKVAPAGAGSQKITKFFGNSA